jgi:prephenate dehydratase
MIKIGFLGPKGTFSHEALEIYIDANRDKEFIPCEYLNMKDILYAVDCGEIDESILPIENSIEGAVNATMDLLISKVQLQIKGELIMNISENLLIKKGSDINNISMVLSHSQPIGQCRDYINTKFSKVAVKHTASTTEAAIEVANSKGDKAAIGSRVAARVYSLDIYESDIQDSDNNQTRFVIISKEDFKRTGKDKSSIAFTTEDKPGSLYRILDIFNLWDINMTRIESRPSKNKFGEYIFFVDILGHRDDEDLSNAITMVKRKCSFFKFLGSYPAFDLNEYNY